MQICVFYYVLIIHLSSHLRHFLSTYTNSVFFLLLLFFFGFCQLFILCVSIQSLFLDSVVRVWRYNAFEIGWTFTLLDERKDNPTNRLKVTVHGEEMKTGSAVRTVLCTESCRSCSKKNKNENTIVHREFVCFSSSFSDHVFVVLFSSFFFFSSPLFLCWDFIFVRGGWGGGGEMVVVGVL